jgi:hypothetical protein
MMQMAKRFSVIESLANWDSVHERSLKIRTIASNMSYDEAMEFVNKKKEQDGAAASGTYLIVAEDGGVGVKS